MYLGPMGSTGFLREGSPTALCQSSVKSFVSRFSGMKFLKPLVAVVFPLFLSRSVGTSSNTTAGLLSSGESRALPQVTYLLEGQALTMRCWLLLEIGRRRMTSRRIL